MEDLTLPEDWRCVAWTGWQMDGVADQRGLGSNDTPLVQLTENPPMWHPERFSLTVHMGEPVQCSVALFFRILPESLAMQLAGIVTFDDDADQVLDRLRAQGSVDQWKRKGFTQLTDDNQLRIAALIESHSPEDGPLLRSIRERSVQIARTTPLNARERVTDSLLDEVAAIYRRAQEDGLQGPTRAVHEELLRRRGKLSYSYAAKLVMRARKAGKLPEWTRPLPGRNDG